MNIDLNETEVRLIKKLLKKELTHTKTEVKLVKIFDLQNKLNILTIPVINATCYISGCNKKGTTWFGRTLLCDNHKS